MNTNERRAAVNNTLAPYGIFLVKRAGDRADKILRSRDADASAIGEASAALKRLAAQYRASGHTPAGYMRGDAVDAGFFEGAAARVQYEAPTAAFVGPDSAADYDR